MEYTKGKAKNIKQEFNPRDAIFVFSSFTFICTAIIFGLIVYDILTIHKFLSFDQPVKISISIAAASIGLLLFGILAAASIPSKHTDDTSKEYQSYSVAIIVSFMFAGVLFESDLCSCANGPRGRSVRLQSGCFNGIKSVF